MRRITERLWGVVVIAAAASAVLVPAAPASASSPSIAWSITPAGPEGADGRVSIRANVEPGAVIHDHVELSNLSDEPLAFDLMGADGLITPEGDFDVLTDGGASTRAGRWIGVAAQHTLEPRSSVVVPVTITVPADALPGDHPAGIVASLARDRSADDSVSFVARTGLRLHLRVAGDLAPALTPTITALEYEPNGNPFAPGRLKVTWEIANTGNVRLGGVPTLSVAGAGGLLPQVQGQRIDEFRELLPAGSRTGVVTVEAWPLFALTADAVVAPTVVGDDQVDVTIPTATGSATAVAIPWTQLALIVVAAGIVFLIVRRLRRRDATMTDAAAAPAAASDDRVLVDERV